MLQAVDAVLTGLGLALAGLWGARVAAHALILKGLRAPRVAALTGPASLGLAAQPVRHPRAQWQNTVWLVRSGAWCDKTPAIVVMHGWGANASMMLPSVGATCWTPVLAVLLLDARCHGASGDEAFTSLPRFAQDIEAGLDWLARQSQVDAHRPGGDRAFGRRGRRPAERDATQ